MGVKRFWIFNFGFWALSLGLLAHPSLSVASSCLLDELKLQSRLVALNLAEQIPEQSDVPEITAFMDRQRRQFVDMSKIEKMGNIDEKIENVAYYFRPPVGHFRIIRNSKGKIVGTGAYTTLSPGVCELEKIYLDPELRGTGIGKKLIMTLLHHAKEQGFRTMELETITSMEDAIRLYKALGFHEIHRPPRGPIDRFFSIDLSSWPPTSESGTEGSK